MSDDEEVVKWVARDGPMESTNMIVYRDSVVQIPLNRVEIKRLDKGLPLPKYESAGAAGIDLYATKDVSIFSTNTHATIVPTGIAVAIPVGYEAQIRSRSGLAAKESVMVLNSPGTIDSDYRGEIQVIMRKIGPGVYNIKRGDRIAQMVISTVASAQLIEVDELDETVRGDGKFGSTGS